MSVSSFRSGLRRLGRATAHLSGAVGACLAALLLLTEWGASQWVALPLLGYALGYATGKTAPALVRRWRRVSAVSVAQRDLAAKTLVIAHELNPAQRARANHRLRTRVAPRLPELARSALFELLDTLDILDQHEQPGRQHLGAQPGSSALDALLQDQDVEPALGFTLTSLPGVEQVQLYSQARQLRESLLPESLRLYFTLSRPTRQAEQLLHSQLRLFIDQAKGLVREHEALALRPMQVQQQFLEDKWSQSPVDFLLPLTSAAVPESTRQ